MSKFFSRRYRNLLKKISSSTYSPVDAMEFLPSIANANFIETVDLHISLALNPKYADQQLRANVVLPKGTGKIIRIAVITDQEDQLLSALKVGADIVGAEDLIDKIAKGFLDFDKLIVVPSVMPLVAKLGRILGPRGLMPSPKAGTVTDNLISAIAEFKTGKLEYRADRTGIVHVPLGKVNFTTNNLIANLIAVRDSIEKNRPTGVRGKYWKSVYISTTMSPSMSIDLQMLLDL